MELKGEGLGGIHVVSAHSHVLNCAQYMCSL